MARAEPRRLVTDPAPVRIRTGVGSSEDGDARAAGSAAASAAMVELAGPAALVMVCTSVRYDLPALLAAVRERTGGATLVGVTSSGHLHNGTITMPGRGVTVLAMTAGPYRFGVSSVTGVSTDPVGAGRSMARVARHRARAGGPAGARPYHALVILADGLAGRQQELLDGAYRVTGAGVPMVGGGAADDRRMRRTSVFHDDRVLSDAAVGVWIDSPWPLTVGSRHGWQPVGVPQLVTRTEGPVVHEIGGRPAVEVMRNHLWRVRRPVWEALPEQPDSAGWEGRPDRRDRPESAGQAERRERGQRAESVRRREVADRREREQRTEPEPLRLDWAEWPGFNPASALGVIQPDGSQLIRALYQGEDGRMRTLSPLPAYASVQLASTRPNTLLAVVDDVVAEATAGREPSVLLVFSCVARLELLGDRRAEEARRLRDAAAPAATFGFYTYGEFARSDSVAGYHNATLTAIGL